MHLGGFRGILRELCPAGVAKSNVRSPCRSSNAHLRAKVVRGNAETVVTRQLANFSTKSCCSPRNSKILMAPYSACYPVILRRQENTATQLDMARVDELRDQFEKFIDFNAPFSVYHAQENLQTIWWPML